IMKNIFTALLFVELFLSFTLSAQNAPPLTIHVEEAGTLSAFIPESRKHEITNLTISGKLNGSDIKLIRDIAGRSFNNHSTGGKLEFLDLSKATIVKGGSYYYSNPNNVYTSDNVIGAYFFSNLSKLSTLILPENITEIGELAFALCSSLKEITIPKSVTKIGYFAFSACSKLTKLKIPSKITHIGDGITHGCTQLEEIHVDPLNSNFTSIDNVLLTKDKSCLVSYAAAKKDTVYTIISDISRIGRSAFSYCSNLRTIICTSPIPPNCDSNSFTSHSFDKCILTVPKGSYAAYWIAPGWCDFKNIVEGTPTSNEIISPKSYEIYNTDGGIVVDSEKSIRISIYDMQGKIVSKTQIEIGYNYIPLSGGVYVIKTSDYSQKIIVK
ncbi:leucine-rich repeat domain-containing protein, partial [Parabacteroides sp. OttesenSCG-928-G06]|nr:leucine-rich repeat domain-containing protein [Parabacteroides sp. OttesenSCG-928-G06]